MRYAQGGGLTDEQREFRERLRLQAAERFAAGETNTVIAKELRVSVRSVQRWRRSWAAGGSRALASAGHDPLPDETGGELGFDRSRRALCAGAAFVSLGDGERAEAEATTALELFARTPEAARWSAGELGPRVDPAAAHTMRGDLAGTEDALAEVFAPAPPNAAPRR
ncbi:helix-turn-helix domain-containing protein [Saccharothrix syringae]|uniref:helix-turn-helix domain-containing protein n=1 Tax=Saccharothrix syringae TaxID=103733 RepID=UPI000A47AAA5|nr:helix-turn-helix domain-containing protein [Saccharothrix syringae]